MVWEAVALFAGSWLVEIGKQKVSEILLNGVEQKLNPNDVQKFLEYAVNQANQKVSLFHRCEADGLKGSKRFVSQFFAGRALTELRKPLKGSGRPDDKLLAALFYDSAQEHSIGQKLKQEDVLPWITIFVETYFKLTDAFIEIQQTAVSYCQRLSRKLGKVVFDGMAIDKKVVDEAGELTKLFVMPDIQTSNNSWQSDLGNIPKDVLKDAQKRILWEQQQQQAHLRQNANAQSSFSAAELVTTPDKRRVVFVGAPGAGKTTLVN
ncbi:MAG: hypothetical protein AAGA83_20835 [Cyanobacteria bacterium P01_F01_bin.116]